MSKYFGYAKNDKVCSCGRHFGCGEWTPEQRAALAKRMSDWMPQCMTEAQRGYLASWEKHHGVVRYRMEIVGKNSVTFDKNAKGKDVIGAVFVDPSEVMEVNDIFKKRTDIYG